MQGLEPALSGRLDLLSLASQSLTDEVRQALSGLGYAAEVLGRHDWETPRRWPIVLSLGRSDYPCERICSFLATMGSTPKLGVFERGSFASHSTVLNRCTDFLAWPSHREELALRLRRAGVAPPPSAERREDRRTLLETFARLNLLGSSPEFVRVLELIRKLGRTDAPVLVLGETGTGKELAARAVHYLGLRHEQPFVPVNCGAIPDSLVENELFGHERGAFTDAKGTQPGLVAQADGGTLFLDEVDSLSLRAQVALLRFLEDHEYRPLGGLRLRKVDVRVLAASHLDLQELAERGEFRQDLMFRLNVLQLKLPPLAARTGDIELLAHHFLRQYSRRYRQPVKGIHPQALAWMDAYRWPGNVRELENLLHRAFVVSEGRTIELGHILGSDGAGPERGEGEPPFAESFQEAKARIVERFERDYLSWLMREAGGNVSLAARRAGKERRSLGKLLKKHGIRRSRYVLEP